uniref:Uncharacterized protein n=1 Tax=Anguilla anguilla TaxID=7936 RepID=A0A0E9T4K4_ANGAN
MRTPKPMRTAVGTLSWSESSFSGTSVSVSVSSVVNAVRFV